MKKRSLALGILLGIAVVVSLGVVYIDSVQNYWYVNSGFVKLIVSNQTQQAIMTVDTNTMRVGFNTNNTARSFVVTGQKPATNLTGNGTSASTTGRIQLNGGAGGESRTANDASGGLGGGIIIVGGLGGGAASSNNATGGAGGLSSIAGGDGNPGGLIATNAIIGGAGGTASLNGGLAGIPSIAATQTVGGAGGPITSAAADGGTPSAGWSRLGGPGGGVSFVAGNGGAGTRTNSGAGGSASFTAGNSGSVGTTPGNANSAGAVNFTAGNSGSAAAGGNPSPGGLVNITAGSGSTGTTNSDGGHVYAIGGAPGSGAVPGNVVVGRNSAGTARGGLQVGPIVTGTTATLTNLLTITATLDFPSLAAGTVTDLPVAFAGAADGDVVTVMVPLSSVTNCMWLGFASNEVVYVRAHNGQLVTGQDPNSGLFRIKLEKYR